MNGHVDPSQCEMPKGQCPDWQSWPTNILSIPQLQLLAYQAVNALSYEQELMAELSNTHLTLLAEGELLTGCRIPMSSPGV